MSERTWRSHVLRLACVGGTVCGSSHNKYEHCIYMMEVGVLVYVEEEGLILFFILTCICVCICMYSQVIIEIVAMQVCFDLAFPTSTPSTGAS